MAVEPKELLAEINTHREEQTNELEELRRQIAFFHTYFPEDIVEDSLNSRLGTSRNVVSSGQLSAKDAQELLEVLILSQKGLQEQERRQEVCQRRWRQLLEDLAACKTENQNQAKLMADQRGRHKESLQACDNTVQNCRQQLESLCDGVTQDALRTVNAQLDKLEAERRVLAEELEKALAEKNQWESRSKTEKLRRENADQLYRETEVLRDRLEELQKSTASERTSQLELLVCRLETRLGKSRDAAGDRAEADWRAVAIELRQDGQRLQEENNKLHKALTQPLPSIAPEMQYVP